MGMVPGGRGRPVPQWCLMRTRRQRSWCPFALRCAHKGGIKPLCAVLCCVVPSLVCVTGYCASRGHPAPSGALRLADHERPCGGARHQGAPSTIRRIETARPSCMSPNPVRPVREHPAPSGALRPDSHCAGCGRDSLLREYPAPSGALRRGELFTDSGFAQRQGAPSTVRCICALAPEEQVVVLCPSARVAEADQHRGGAACGCGISISPVSFCSVVRTQGPRIR